MLYAARRLAEFGMPLVGVNQGRLGFMTDIAREEMLAAGDGAADADMREFLDGELAMGRKRLDELIDEIRTGMFAGDIAAVPPTSGMVVSTVAPSMNCTVPVARDGVTVAVKVTPCP